MKISQLSVSFTARGDSMIRRDGQLPTGTAAWVLIDQAEHARLAGELAAVWGAGGVAPLEPRDEVLCAVQHHDDGWPPWDALPKLDEQTGRPRQFTEMLPADALAIWRSSIEHAGQFGPLPAWLVAGHFLALLQGSGHAELPLAQRWAREFDKRSAAWLAAWQAGDPATNRPALAQRGLRQLQMFDALSLWLCCAERREPRQFDTPDGPTVTVTPRSPQHVTIDPWPLTVARLSLAVPGRQLSAQPYATTEWPAAVDNAARVELVWHLAPG